MSLSFANECLLSDSGNDEPVIVVDEEKKKKKKHRKDKKRRRHHKRDHSSDLEDDDVSSSSEAEHSHKKKKKRRHEKKESTVTQDESEERYNNQPAATAPEEENTPTDIETKASGVTTTTTTTGPKWTRCRELVSGELVHGEVVVSSVTNDRWVIRSNTDKVKPLSVPLNWATTTAASFLWIERINNNNAANEFMGERETVVWLVDNTFVPVDLKAWQKIQDAIPQADRLSSAAKQAITRAAKKDNNIKGRNMYKGSMNSGGVMQYHLPECVFKKAMSTTGCTTLVSVDQPSVVVPTTTTVNPRSAAGKAAIANTNAMTDCDRVWLMVLERRLVNELEPQWRSTTGDELSLVERCQKWRAGNSKIYSTAYGHADPVARFSSLFESALVEKKTESEKTELCMSVMMRMFAVNNVHARALLDDRENKYKAEMQSVDVEDASMLF